MRDTSRQRQEALYYRTIVLFRSWMIDRGEHFRLALKARNPLRIAGVEFRQYLDGDVTIELGIPRAEHLTHASLTQRRQDFVRSQFSSRFQRHLECECLSQGDRASCRRHQTSPEFSRWRPRCKASLDKSGGFALPCRHVAFWGIDLAAGRVCRRRNQSRALGSQRIGTIKFTVRGLAGSLALSRAEHSRGIANRACSVRSFQISDPVASDSERSR